MKGGHWRIELSDDSLPPRSTLPPCIWSSVHPQQAPGHPERQTRTEVRGGGRKIYRQKGTGNARHHGNRAPQFTHGGVVFAPKPRDYASPCPRRCAACLQVRPDLQGQAGEIMCGQLKLEAKTRSWPRPSSAGRHQEGLVVAERDETSSAPPQPGRARPLMNTLNVYDILRRKVILTKAAPRSRRCTPNEGRTISSAPVLTERLTRASATSATSLRWPLAPTDRDQAVERSSA